MQFFSIKRASLLKLWIENQNPLLWKLWAKILVLSPMSHEFFCRPTPQLPTLNIVLNRMSGIVFNYCTECKQLPDFRFMSKRTLRKLCRKLGFYNKRSNKKCKCINSLVLILCLQPETILKTRLPQRCFLASFFSF